MRNIDLTKTGGFPLDEESLDFVQIAYTEAISAIAASFGNKVILGGMQIVAGDVTEGWFIYNGEVIKFTESAQNTYIKISNTGTNATFEDGIDKSVFFNKTAVCDYSGDFLFADLVRMSAYNELEKAKLDATWVAGDIKMISCDNAYIATNFDSTGLGRLARLGWAICNGDNGTANMRGRVPVGFDANTIDPADNVWDAAYNTMGTADGEKKHLLTSAESGLPAHNHPAVTREANTGGGSLAIGNGGTTSSATVDNNTAADAAQAHENRQPFIVTLFIQKL